MAGEETRSKKERTRTEILSIGGGKGGTGKSLIAACIGVCLAERGSKVLLIDGDLGTANLHTLLGLDTPKIGLSDFIAKKNVSINGATTETRINNLKLISGARDMIGVANLSHGQKLKILNNIKKLDYDYVLIDLGPGTSFNMLDFFLISRRGILVTTPEPTSIENTYRFIKAAVFRYLRNAMGQETVKKLIDQGIRDRGGQKFTSIFDLLDTIQRVDAGLAEDIKMFIKRLEMHLIVNQSDSAEDRDLGRKMTLAIRKYLGIPIDFLGTVSYAGNLRKGLWRKRPVTMYYPHSRLFMEISEISWKIMPAQQLGLNFSGD